MLTDINRMMIGTYYRNVAYTSDNIVCLCDGCSVCFQSIGTATIEFGYIGVLLNMCITFQHVLFSRGVVLGHKDQLNVLLTYHGISRIPSIQMSNITSKTTYDCSVCLEYQFSVLESNHPRLVLTYISYLYPTLSFFT